MAKEKVKKPFYKKFWFWVLAVIVIAVAVNGGEESKETAAQPAKVEKAAEPAKTEKAAKKVFGLNEAVTVDKFTYTVKSVNETNKLSNVLGDKTTSGKFVIVEVDVKNGDKKARLVDGEMFRIKAGGNEYEANIEYDMYVNEGDIGFFLKEINPGISKAGKVVFELPADVASYDLEVSSGLGWSGGKYEMIKLK
ncbi:DUF4352 domain-containing protein [Ectobacillus antri]|uniref:DUF4352 domain-containing protein n=1 Tax=Ectobacillus antri TaxID=2486280 RepID=UPI000F5B1D8B|nr:DUF4352 domain-containing protein [Ectobacillus antri]